MNVDRKQLKKEYTQRLKDYERAMLQALKSHANSTSKKRNADSTDNNGR